MEWHRPHELPQEIDRSWQFKRITGNNALRDQIGKVSIKICKNYALLTAPVLIQKGTLKSFTKTDQCQSKSELEMVKQTLEEKHKEKNYF